MICRKSKNVYESTNVMRDRRRFIISFIGLLGPLSAVAQTKGTNSKPEKARDPVCGILVEKDPQLSADYKGRTYYFCSKADRDKFKENPEKYVKDK
jgi:YHS domain-containing protein